MKQWHKDAIFGGLVGLALGVAAGIAVCASGHATLERTQGLALALGASVVVGATSAASATARTGPGRSVGSTTLFGAIVAIGVCMLLRRVGWSDLNLYGFGAGFAPWGQLATTSLPIVGLATGALTALDARTDQSVKKGSSV